MHILSFSYSKSILIARRDYLYDCEGLEKVVNFVAAAAVVEKCSLSSPRCKHLILLPLKIQTFFRIGTYSVGLTPLQKTPYIGNLLLVPEK
jgi:hypothetical protein